MLIDHLVEHHLNPGDAVDIANLNAFTAVADTASFSLAAERLHLTQPAVSKRIAALEAELDTLLFDRLGRKVLLTEAGRMLLPRARRILVEAEDSRRALRNLSGRVAGVLSLATSHHIGLHRLPPVLREYASRYAEVQLDMHFMDSEVACEVVAKGDVELGIVTLPTDPSPPLQTFPVWTDRLLAVANREHPLAQQGPISPALLSRYPAIMPGEATFTRRIIDRLFQPWGIQLQVAFATNYLETIKMMVSVGLGWSILPHTMVDGDLVALGVTDLKAERTLGAAVHAGRTLSNAAQAMLDVLQTQ